MSEDQEVNELQLKMRDAMDENRYKIAKETSTELILLTSKEKELNIK
jgi:hypothetical protein